MNMIKWTKIIFSRRWTVSEWVREAQLQVFVKAFRNSQRMVISELLLIKIKFKEKRNAISLRKELSQSTFPKIFSKKGMSMQESKWNSRNSKLKSKRNLKRAFWKTTFLKGKKKPKQKNIFLKLIKIMRSSISH